MQKKKFKKKRKHCFDLICHSFVKLKICLHMAVKFNLQQKKKENYHIVNTLHIMSMK